MSFTTINDYIKKAQFVRDNILDESQRIVEKNENEIIALNIEQIDDSRGSDGKMLKNRDSRFKGIYTLATQMMDDGQGAPKIAGDPYNFVKTGAFINGFELQISNDLTKASIFSTGTGSGDKKSFFDGYNNMFGLDKENERKMNYDIIKPELDKFIKQHL